MQFSFNPDSTLFISVHSHPPLIQPPFDSHSTLSQLPSNPDSTLTQPSFHPHPILIQLSFNSHSSLIQFSLALTQLSFNPRQPSFNPHSTLIQPSFNYHSTTFDFCPHSTVIQPSFNSQFNPRSTIVQPPFDSRSTLSQFAFNSHPSLVQLSSTPIQVSLNSHSLPWFNYHSTIIQSSSTRIQHSFKFHSTLIQPTYHEPLLNSRSTLARPPARLLSLAGSQDKGWQENCKARARDTHIKRFFLRSCRDNAINL